MSALNVFCTQLINFFDELASAIPEEKDIKTALEMIKMAKTANPRLMADLFYDNFYVDFNEIIMARDIDRMVSLGKTKIQSSYNELSPAIMIFDKHWGTLSSVSQDAIWKYMQLLCKLVVKTR